MSTPPRVTSDDVVALMPDLCGDLNLDAQIRQASYITDKVQAQDTNSQLNDEALFLIEANLAAHFYSFVDQQYLNKMTGEASGAFQGKTEMALDYSPWGQTAKILDVTGFLAALDQQAETGRKRVGVLWLGTRSRRDRSI